jgi:hypothetical protein
MKFLGIAGLLLALAIVGYLVASYLQEGARIQETLRTAPGASGGSGAAQPVDVTRRGLERRLAPALDQEGRRLQDTNKAASQ